MSRVCVKSLPKHLTEQRFLEIFSKVGEITDCKLLKTKEGQPRHMGFIGYRSEDDAAKAIELLNNTYIDTSKIKVESAVPIGSNDLSRPWSKHSAGSSAYLKSHPEIKAEKERKIAEERAEKAKQKKIEMNNPKLLEFLGLHQKVKKWDNDDTMAEGEKIDEDDGEENGKKRKLSEDKADSKKSKKSKKAKTEQATKDNKTKDNKAKDNKTTETNTKGKTDKKNDTKENNKTKESKTKDKSADKKKSKITDIEAITKDTIKQDKLLQDEFADSDEEYEDLPDPKKQPLYLGDDDEENASAPMEDDDEAEDDLAYIKSKMSAADKKALEKKKEEEEEEEEDERGEKGEKESEGGEKDMGKKVNNDKKRVDEAETGRLFVRNLPFTITEQELRDLFGKYGILSEVHIPHDKESSRSKGIALILYMVPSDATKALKALDKHSFQGRVLHVMPGEEPRVVDNPSIAKDKAKTNGDMHSSSFKKEKEAKKKAESGKTHNWNSMFVRSDAVVEAFCAKHGIKKSELHDPAHSNLAVKLALMETQVIQETKQYLQQQGVNIESLSSSVNKGIKRSDYVILLKNIPFETNSTELTTQFQKHGPLARVIIPPNRTVAIVEFVNPSDAKSAFKALAYRQYRGVPLYLEWAPADLLGSSSGAATTKQNKPSTTTTNPNEASPSLFVSNISFHSTDESVIALFNEFPGYKTMGIPKNRDPSTGLQTLSSGIAFVNFSSVENADAAMKRMQGYELDGHKIKIAYSVKKPKKDDPKFAEPAQEDTKGSTKLMVRNIPFEASEREVWELFQSAGGFKQVRMPLKMDKSHRGFGFVEFLTHKEAKRALDTMGDTHLYGRHLVMEFAAANRNLDEIREKTAEDFEKSKRPAKKEKPAKVADWWTV